MFSIMIKISLIHVPRGLIDDKQALVQLIAWHQMMTSHHFKYQWLWLWMPYGVTKPQYINECGIELILGNIEI